MFESILKMRSIKLLSNQLRHIVKLKITRILIVAMVFTLSFITYYAQKQACSVYFTDIDNWAITHSTMPSSIIWQKDINTHYGLLTASNGIVLVDGTSSEECTNGNDVTALNSQTGDELWVESFNNPLIFDLYPSSDDGFYITICCNHLVHLNSIGEQEWRSEKMLAKTLRPQIYESGDSVLIVMENASYEVTQDIRLEANSDERIVAMFVEHEIVVSDGQFNIVDISESSVKWSILIPQYLQESITFNLYGNILLVAIETDQIRAYDMRDGNLLWEVDEDSEANPVLYQNMVVRYTSKDILEFRNIETGEEVGAIELDNPYNDPAENQPFINRVNMAVSDSIIFILYDDVAELIAISIEE